MGLPITEDHLVFRWVHDDCKVLFSVTRMGGAVSCHFASDRAGLRHIKKAIDEWCKFVFEALNWCTMVIAQVVKPSVARLVEKCGFSLAGEADGIQIYVRCK